jgi:phosphohistidine phosphatase SixA
MKRFPRPRRRATWHRLVVALLIGFTSPAYAGESLLDLMKRPGHLTFMRHALAPFEGAPKETARTADALGPCETQRNLSDAGRANATRIGNLFRQSGVTFERVYTSKWCRCRDTAELIMQRAVENWPLINSFYTDPDTTKGPAQIAKLKAHLTSVAGLNERMLLVTHGSLITALTGVDTDETEVVIVKADGQGGVIIVGRGVP